MKIEKMKIKHAEMNIKVNENKKEQNKENIDLTLPIDLKTMDTNIIVDFLEQKIKQREQTFSAQMKK